MHAAVRAEGLLAPSSARFSVDKRCRLCKGLGSLLSYPLLVATLCFNPAEGPQTASKSAERVALRATMYTGTGSTHTWRATERRLHLTLRLVWIRIRASMMVIVFAFSVWIRRLRPIFPLSQVELCLAVRERWLTAANFDRRSHCSGTMPNFYFREARQLWTLYRHPLPCDFFLKRRKHQQTDKTQKFLTLDRRSVSPTSTCLCSGAPRPVGDLAGAATSLATESTGTVLTPSPMSEIAGHVAKGPKRKCCSIKSRKTIILTAGFWYLQCNVFEIAIDIFFHRARMRMLNCVREWSAMEVASDRRTKNSERTYPNPATTFWVKVTLTA